MAPFLIRLPDSASAPVSERLMPTLTTFSAADAGMPAVRPSAAAAATPAMICAAVRRVTIRFVLLLVE